MMHHFVLMVRASLKQKIRQIADLKGRVIGVNTSTNNSKTTSQQLAKLLLESDGVSLDQVRIVPAGQNWEEQSSLILSGAADAIMGDKPFASRLLAMGKVYFLVNLAQPETVKKIQGANFLHAALETRRSVVEEAPHKVEKMTKILRKTLRRLDVREPDQALGIGVDCIARMLIRGLLIQPDVGEAVHDDGLVYAPFVHELDHVAGLELAVALLERPFMDMNVVIDDHDRVNSNR